jgi:GNAT superfamily N-acetyltransferase
MRNFNVLFSGAPVQPILDEIAQHPELWDKYTFRTDLKVMPDNPVYGSSDIILQFHDVMKTPADWQECIRYPAMNILNNARNAVHTLLYTLQSDRLGRAIIAKLAPGGHIKPHKDEKLMCEYYSRCHIWLQGSNTAFRSGDEWFTPKVGDIFWVNNAVEHEVINYGDDDRISIIVDIKSPQTVKTYGPEQTLVAPVQAIPVRTDWEEGIHFQREYCIGTSFIDELKVILPLHYEELALEKDFIPLDPMWGFYGTLEKVSQLHIFTARDGNKLIAYHIGICGRHPHYAQTMHCLTDIYYVLPEYRKNGVGFQFFEALMEDLRSNLGIQKMVCACKKHAEHIKFFELLGFKQSDYTFTKTLRKETPSQN